MEVRVYKPNEPVTLTIVFEDGSEVESLLDELDTWTPRGRVWSENACKLLKALREAKK
jgi:hypothetical protein